MHFQTLAHSALLMLVGAAKGAVASYLLHKIWAGVKAIGFIAYQILTLPAAIAASVTEQARELVSAVVKGLLIVTTVGAVIGAVCLYNRRCRGAIPSAC